MTIKKVLALIGVTAAVAALPSAAGATHTAQHDVTQSLVQQGQQGQLPSHNRITSDSTGGFTGITTSFVGTAAATSSLFDSIRLIVNAFLGLAALVAAVFIVIAGVRYITSGGDEDAAASAKNAIIYALIGLVIILLSAVLVNFVIGIFPL